MKGELKGQFTGKSGLTKEDLDNTVNKFDSQVKINITTKVTEAVKSKLTTTKDEAHTADKNKLREESSSKSKKTTSSTETIGVKFVVGTPTITVK